MIGNNSDSGLTAMAGGVPDGNGNLIGSIFTGVITQIWNRWPTMGGRR